MVVANHWIEYGAFNVEYPVILHKVDSICFLSGVPGVD